MARVEQPTIDVSVNISVFEGMSLREVEDAFIMYVYKKNNFNKTIAARELKIGMRTIQRRLQKLYAKGPESDPGQSRYLSYMGSSDF